MLLVMSCVLRVYHIRDINTGQCVRTYREHTGSVGKVVMRSGGRTVFSASADGYVKLWDRECPNSIQTLKHPSAVSCLQVRGKRRPFLLSDRYLKASQFNHQSI